MRTLLEQEPNKPLITIRPSYLLRIEEEAGAAAEYARFVADLALLRPILG